jgi:hypothetical protein
MLRHSRTVFAPAFLLLSFLAAGCDGDPSGPARPSIQGAYTLQSLNGDPVPALILEWTEPNDEGVDEAYRFEIASATLTLTNDGRFTTTGILRTVNVTRQTVDDVESHNDGTYVVSGGTLTLTPRDGAPATATVQGRDLVLETTAGGPTLQRYVFRKD